MIKIKNNNNIEYCLNIFVGLLVSKLFCEPFSFRSDGQNFEHKKTVNLILIIAIRGTMRILDLLIL